MWSRRGCQDGRSGDTVSSRQTTSQRLGTSPGRRRSVMKHLTIATVSDQQREDILSENGSAQTMASSNDLKITAQAEMDVTKMDFVKFQSI